MSGKFQSLQALVRKIFTMHLDTLHDSQISSCCKRNESCSKYCANNSCNCGELYKNEILKIKTLFCTLREMGAQHSALLFYCDTRWLSRGKVLQRIYKLRDEIAIFLEEENHQKAEQFRDHLCMMKLSYLVDIYEKLNMLNLNFKEKIQLSLTWVTKSVNYISIQTKLKRLLISLIQQRGKNCLFR